MSAVELVVRMSLIMAVGLAANRLLEGHPRARLSLWTACFISPIFLLLPLPEIRLAVLARQDVQLSEAKVVESSVPPLQESQVVYAGDPIPPWPTLLLGGLGALGAVWFCSRVVRTIRTIRGADQVADVETLDLLMELSHQHGLGDVPILKRSDHVSSPFAFGLLQPCIVLPADMQLEGEQLRMTLDHELAHIGRGDSLRLLWFGLIQSLMWWNPLVHFAQRNALLAVEQVIDESFDGNPAYSALLSRVAMTPSSIGFVRLSGSSNLLKRIRTLKRNLAPKQFWPLWGITPVVVFLPNWTLVARYEPAGDRIGLDEVVYLAPTRPGWTLMRVCVDGRGSEPLPSLFTGIGGPSVSPNGRWIAYTRVVNGQEDIFIAKVTGANERCIVSTPARDVQPRWSPDGKQILYCTLETGNWEVGIFEAKSGKSRLVTRDGKRNLEPSWHPSGRSFVFSSHRTGVQKLWHMNLDGTDLQQLTFGGWEDTHGRFSPDGALLAFSTNRRTKNEATLLHLRTGYVQPLVRLGQLDTGEVEFCDEGRSVAMTSWEVQKPRVAKVRVSDLRFEVITGQLEALWPACR